MSSDESFFDENLDKSSPTRSSDRILRSSSISSIADPKISVNLIRKGRSSVMNDKETNDQTTNRSRSFQKIRLSVESASSRETDKEANQIFDVNHLEECIRLAHICPGARLELIIDKEKNIGLFHQNGLKCSLCNEITDLNNFPIKPLHQVQQPNQRLYAASAISGIGYDAMHFVLSLLGINTPGRSNFYKQVHHLYDQLFDFAHADFLALVSEIRQNKKCGLNDVLDLTVSLDGTWKKRGHHSMYGIVFLIEADSGYCLDFETMSKRCELCEAKERELTAIQLQKWYETHRTKCSKNWNGSAGAMEKEGAKRIFERSLEKRLRYMNMISDGDSSAYETVKHTYVNALLKDLSRSKEDSIEENSDHDVANSLSELSPHQYESNLIKKEDCINHIKKRVSNHLKVMKNRYSGLEDAPRENSVSRTKKKKQIQTRNHSSSHSNPHSSSDDDGIHSSAQLDKKRRRRRRLADGKPYGGGNGRMTKTMEQNLADCYGLAIRQSSESAKDLVEDDAVSLMERCCRAAFLHNIKQPDRERQHALCPTGPQSWCSYQADKHVPSKQKKDPAKDIKRLDPIFLEVLTPMIATLTDPNLLRRCLRGATQNANESINSVVWSILPKSKHHGYRSIRGAAAIAAIFFNRGRSGLIKFFDQVGIAITEELLDALLGKDFRRIEKAETNNQRRNIIKQRKEEQRIEAQIAEEEEMDYKSGMF